MRKKIHIKDLENKPDLEGRVSIPIGTEIEFDKPEPDSKYQSTKIPIGTEIEFDVPKSESKPRSTKPHIDTQSRPDTPKEPNNTSNIKTWLIAGAIAAASIIGYNQLSKEAPDKIKSEFDKTIPEGYVAGAKHNGKTFFFTNQDPIIRDLSARRAYIDINKGEVDVDVLHKSLNLLNQQSMAQLMKTANLNNMYRGYASIDGGEPNYEKALKDLWAQKNSRWGNNFLEIAEAINNEYDSKSSKKTTFHDYKQKINEELENIVDDLKNNGFLSKFYNEDTMQGHPERKRFMENYLSAINGKAVMSYFLTELFPDINPAANIVFKNKLLKEAGEDFINNIPALSDSYLSMGPGQLTSYVINPGGAPMLNRYLSDHNKIPQSMEEFSTSEHHIKGSILNLKHNAINLMNRLYTNNQLTNFNDLFEELSADDRKKFIAGHASAAHHATSLASTRYLQHTSKANEGLVDLADTKDMDLGRLRQYHDQSLRNFSVLKKMKEEEMYVR